MTDLEQARTDIKELQRLVANLHQRLAFLEVQLQPTPPSKKAVFAYMERHGGTYDEAVANLLAGVSDG